MNRVINKIAIYHSNWQKSKCNYLATNLSLRFIKLELSTKSKIIRFSC